MREWPKQESAKTTFQNDLLARDGLHNQLRYRQLRPYRSVKRVETWTVIRRGHRAGTTAKPSSNIDNSTCAIVRSVVNIQDSSQCRLCSSQACSRPGPAYRYAPSGLPFPPLRGGPLLVKPPTATPVRRPRTAVPQGNTTFQDRRNRNVDHGISRTPANTKKSLQTISRLKTLSKHGGFLLSHLVWQYHRR